MANLHAQSRMTYLHESAHSLSLSAPAVAAFLESKCDSLARTAEIKLPDFRYQGICRACGNILVTGCHSRLDEKYSSRQRQHSTNSQSPSVKSQGPISRKSLKCDRCSRTTIIQPEQFYAQRKVLGLNMKETVPQARPQGTQSSSDTLAPAMGSHMKSKESSRRKHRANARKQGSLQAMLMKGKADASRANTGGDFGLDLIDLMKRD